VVIAVCFWVMAIFILIPVRMMASDTPKLAFPYLNKTVLGQVVEA